MLEREIRDPGGGVNQSGIRDHNERLVLSLIQRHGALAGIDIARRAGLSPQTVSVILRSLENEGFLLRGDPLRGRVGKPSTPMVLNPDGILSVGMKIGRRSADLVLIDVLGNVRSQQSITYRFPEPDRVFAFLEAGMADFRGLLPPDHFARIAGIGIATPFELWNWAEVIGARPEESAAWYDVGISERIAVFSDLHVHVENDATAACRAEHVFGLGRKLTDFAYFFVGSFIGGGVVLNHSVYLGQTGNAGAFGTLPVPGPNGPRQLIDAASIHSLENRLRTRGIDVNRLWSQPQDWSAFEADVADWIEQTATALASAVVSVCSVIDFESVLIDGGFPPDVRARLTRRVRDDLAGVDSRGIRLPTVDEGAVGGNARAIGAACAPIFDRFLLNTNIVRS